MQIDPTKHVTVSDAKSRYFFIYAGLLIVTKVAICISEYLEVY